MVNERIVQHLKGHSGSEVVLMEDDFKTFVRKVGGVDRNLERYKEMRKWRMNIPVIYNVGHNHYDMEYIPNLDVKSYLLMGNDVSALTNYIAGVAVNLASTQQIKDYTQTYETKLDESLFEHLHFNKSKLIKKLPKVLPQTAYHGDFTLENILYDVSRNRFVMIDPLTTVYDSIVFDMAKLRQDLVCKWFIRDSKTMLDSKLKTMYDNLKHMAYPDDDVSLLILMLLRVLPYAQNDFDKKYLIDEMNRLWK